MALLKPFFGTEEEFKSVPLHAGYIYLTEDGNLFADVEETDGTVTRIQINGYAASVLRAANGTDEVDYDDVIAATSVAYYPTLYASGWVANNGTYTYTYSNTDLTCGKDGTVPPIVTYRTNLDEYSKIDSAEATAGVGITFYASEAFSNDIDIIVTDVK